MPTHDALRQLRKKKGLSQEYVAHMLNISQSNYSRLESGRVRIVADHLPRLANILECDVIAFFPRLPRETGF